LIRKFRLGLVRLVGLPYFGVKKVFDWDLLFSSWRSWEEEELGRFLGLYFLEGIVPNPDLRARFHF